MNTLSLIMSQIYYAPCCCSILENEICLNYKLHQNRRHHCNSSPLSYIHHGHHNPSFLANLLKTKTTKMQKDRGRHQAHPQSQIITFTLIKLRSPFAKPPILTILHNQRNTQSNEHSHNLFSPLSHPHSPLTSRFHFNLHSEIRYHYPLCFTIVHNPLILSQLNQQQ